jgi:hypothetical protein
MQLATSETRSMPDLAKFARQSSATTFHSHLPSLAQIFKAIQFSSVIRNYDSSVW